MDTKSIIGIVIVAVLLIGATVFSRQSLEPEKVALGVILPLTGDAASYGEHARNAVELAREKAETNFGILFDMRYEDSQIKPALAVNAAQKLISSDNVNYLISFSSGETLAICPLAETNKRLLFGSGSSPSITTDCGAYTFRNYPSDIFQGKALARIIGEKGFSKVALFYINNDYGVGLKDEFVKNFSGAVAVEEGHMPQTRDFRTSVAKLKSASIDALVLISQLSEASLLLEQMREQGVNMQMFASEALKDGTLIQNTKPESVKNLSALFTEAYSGPEANTFKSSYVTRFKKEPGAFADYVYDNVLTLARALKACRKDDVLCVQKELGHLSFIGATGSISFDENGDVKDKPYELYKIESGSFILAH